MSEQRPLLAESVGQLLEAHADAAARAQADGWQGGLWAEVEALGIPALLVPEECGGVGADWDDACAVLQASGYWQVPLPVAESMLAARLAATAGLALPEGPATTAVRAVGVLAAGVGGWRFSGVLAGVPWGRDAGTVVTTLPHAGVTHVVLLRREDARLRAAMNLAGEPRDDLTFDGALALAAPTADRVAILQFEHAALLRAAQMAGALESALDRSVAYARERKQFGKVIGQFQAVQQQLAVFGAEAAAVACAVRAAGIAASFGAAVFQIAAAKLRANLAVGTATATAHQVHAAIGFTWEYALRHASQRLWSWRSEFGNDRYWSERLGAGVLARGADAFWSDLTARDDAASAAASDTTY